MAHRVEVRAVDGAVAGTIELDDAVFGIEPNMSVLHQVVTAQLAAARSGTQSTKTRAEVSGGGKKPFKQKGTGRARQGSTRAPHWTGGGVALGPKPRSYRQKTPRKMIRLALRSALSDRASEDRVAVVQEWPWTAPKTKDATAALAALALTGKVLVVLDREVDEAAYLAFRNLVEIQVILTGELNAYDILCNDWVVFTRHNLPGASTDVSPTDVTSTDVTSTDVTSTDVSPSDVTPTDAGSADAAPSTVTVADEPAAAETPSDEAPEEEPVVSDTVADEGDEVEP